jgi:TRAP-type C4-dicarboxylate transport system permease small subunit
VSVERKDWLIEPVFRRVERVLAALAIAAVVALMVLSSGDAIARYFLNGSIAGAYEFSSEYLIIAAIYLSLQTAYRDGGFVRIGLLLERASTKVKCWLNAIAHFVSTAVCVFLTFAACLKAYKVFHEGSLSGGVIQYPLWPAYTMLTVGMAVMALRLIFDLPKSFSPNPPLADSISEV